MLSARPWRSPQQQSVGAVRARQQRRRRSGVRQAHETVRLLARRVLSGAHRQAPVPQPRPPVRRVRRARVRHPARRRERVRRTGGRPVRFQFQTAGTAKVLVRHGRAENGQQACLQRGRAQRMERRRWAAGERCHQPGAIDIVDGAEGVRPEFQGNVPLSGRKVRSRSISREIPIRVASVSRHRVLR